ncbi:hypothetical protein, partial [Pseudomonas viridiflava]|uniref:hypothetical protein n=1 Tax=Pseudomonas viridiflava TaxID=33069 RepID=UPI00197EE976
VRPRGGGRRQRLRGCFVHDFLSLLWMKAMHVKQSAGATCGNYFIYEFMTFVAQPTSGDGTKHSPAV